MVSADRKLVRVKDAAGQFLWYDQTKYTWNAEKNKLEFLNEEVEVKSKKQRAAELRKQAEMKAAEAKEKAEQEAAEAKEAKAIAEKEAKEAEDAANDAEAAAKELQARRKDKK